MNGFTDRRLKKHHETHKKTRGFKGVKSKFTQGKNSAECNSLAQHLIDRDRYPDRLFLNGEDMDDITIKHAIKEASKYSLHLLGDVTSDILNSIDKRLADYVKNGDQSHLAVYRKDNRWFAIGCNAENQLTTIEFEDTESDILNEAGKEQPSHWIQSKIIPAALVGLNRYHKMGKVERLFSLIKNLNPDLAKAIMPLEHQVGPFKADVQYIRQMAHQKGFTLEQRNISRTCYYEIKGDEITIKTECTLNSLTSPPHVDYMKKKHPKSTHLNDSYYQRGINIEMFKPKTPIMQLNVTYSCKIPDKNNLSAMPAKVNIELKDAYINRHHKSANDIFPKYSKGLKILQHIGLVSAKISSTLKITKQSRKTNSVSNSAEHKKLRTQLPEDLAESLGNHSLHRHSIPNRVPALDLGLEQEKDMSKEERSRPEPTLTRQ